MGAKGLGVVIERIDRSEGALGRQLEGGMGMRKDNISLLGKIGVRGD